MGDVTRIPRQISTDADNRLRRLRRLAWLLDRSVSVGPNARFGLDPILGLIPGLGDWIGAVLSLYVVYEGLRLGLPWSVLTRMLGNVAVETVLGAVPLAGDVFDFFWQANARNLQLVEEHYRPGQRPRSMRSVGTIVALIAVVMIGATIGAIMVAVWLLREFWQLISG